MRVCALHRLGEAEIGEFSLTVRVKQQIVALEVAVDDWRVAFVQKGQAQRAVQSDLQAPFPRDRRRRLFQQATHGASAHKLSDDRQRLPHRSAKEQRELRVVRDCVHTGLERVND